MSANKNVSLPTIRLAGVYLNGDTYISRGDVIEWLFACADVANKEGLPIQVEQFTTGIARSLAASKGKPE